MFDCTTIVFVILLTDAKGVSALVLLPYLVNERGAEIFTTLVRTVSCICELDGNISRSYLA